MQPSAVLSEQLLLIYDATQSDFEKLESNKFVKIVSFSCKTTEQNTAPHEIAAINTLIWHNFCLLRCQQPCAVKTGSDEENGKTYVTWRCNTFAWIQQY